MLNLDPGLLDQDNIRLKKRKKLFIFALLPIILFSIFAIFFLRTGVFNIVTSIKVANENYNSSDIITNSQTILNLIEPYLVYYDRGFLKLSNASNMDELSAAGSDFQESLKQNPPEDMLCSIYGNLSYTIELQGDLYSKDKNYSEALISYNQAEALLYKNGCANEKSSDGKGKDDLSEAAKERLINKRKKTIEVINNVEEGGDGGDEGESTDPGQEIDDETLKKLKESQDNSARDSAENFRYWTGGRGSQNSSSNSLHF